MLDDVLPGLAMLVNGFALALQSYDAHLIIVFLL
jgi:hypothetical protein